MRQIVKGIVMSGPTGGLAAHIFPGQNVSCHFAYFNEEHIDGNGLRPGYSVIVEVEGEESNLEVVKVLDSSPVPIAAPDEFSMQP